MPYKHIQNYFSFLFYRKERERGSWVEQLGIGEQVSLSYRPRPQEKLFYLFLYLIWQTCVNNKQCTLFVHIINFTFCIRTLNSELHTIAILVLIHSGSPREPEQIYGADHKFTSLINRGCPGFLVTKIYIYIYIYTVLASDCCWLLLLLLLLASSFLLGEEAELKNRDVGEFLLCLLGEGAIVTLVGGGKKDI